MDNQYTKETIQKHSITTFTAVFQGSDFNRKDKIKNPLENTYNTDPGDSSQEDPTAITNPGLQAPSNSGGAQQTSKNSSTQKRKGRKRKKRKGRKGPKGRGKETVPAEGGVDNLDTAISRPVLQNVDIKVCI